MPPLLLIGVALGVAAMFFFNTAHTRRRSAEDRDIARRVRTKLARYVAHPSAVDVSVIRGCVVLAGTVAAHEHHDFIDAIADEPGVNDLYDRLKVFERAEGVL
jgi:osmotically-inducible protein OsmY